jgi:hypothetical protein
MGNIDAGRLFQCPRRPSGRIGHQNVKHAVCAAVGGFGQQRPQCDQSALRRFVGDGGAAVGPLKGSARAIGRSLRAMYVLMIKLCVI